MLFVSLANCSGLWERGYYCLLNCKLYEQLQWKEFVGRVIYLQHLIDTGHSISISALTEFVILVMIEQNSKWQKKKICNEECKRTKGNRISCELSFGDYFRFLIKWNNNNRRLAVKREFRHARPLFVSSGACYLPLAWYLEFTIHFVPDRAANPEMWMRAGNTNTAWRTEHLFFHVTVSLIYVCTFSLQ